MGPQPLRRALQGFSKRDSRETEPQPLPRVLQERVLGVLTFASPGHEVWKISELSPEVSSNIREDLQVQLAWLWTNHTTCSPVAATIGESGRGSLVIMKSAKAEYSTSSTAQIN
ncbi:hypothetical protein PanWU01x14_049430 [Parasponia andersonii]|uniref:Uncharacterized protein n=1 Tax=Parasponia andersonii TaxID=3476 RepID=A0A2P5DMM5_PARAD|nr:hypothetical protein PanWU01x14_049430 [Parasponia andersonii]